jgi:hypothetical protein
VPIAIGIAILVGATIGAREAWRHWRDDLVAGDEWRLSAERLSLTPTPEWISADLKQAVMQSGQLDHVHLLDRDALSRVVDALTVQPWIEQITRAEKRPGEIRVALVYRCPVAAVEFGASELVPVDARSCALDGRQLSVEYLKRCWRVSVAPPLAGPMVLGTPWPDQRIQDAAQIADMWGDAGLPLGLVRIVNYSPAETNLADMGPYELWTRQGTRVIWGQPPGREAAGEDTAAVKKQRLLDYIAQHGSLDALPQSVSLDVRFGRVEQINLRRAQSSDLEQLR